MLERIKSAGWLRETNYIGGRWVAAADGRTLVKKVEAHVADAQLKRGRILTGGKRHALGGTFFEPRCSASRTNRKPSTPPTQRSSASPPISTAAISRASFALACPAKRHDRYQ
jgi:hypothetical protein